MKMVHFVIGICFMAFILEVFPQPTKFCETLAFRDGIFDKFNVSAFTDENRYLRLNVSWGEPKGDFEYIDIMIDTNDACGILYGVQNYSVNNQFLIKPTMEIEHPADPLIHGCDYQFTVDAKVNVSNETCTVSQSLNYIVPATTENPASHKYDVENGIKIRWALSLKRAYSSFIEVQNYVNSMPPNVAFKLLSQDNSMRFCYSAEINLDGALVYKCLGSINCEAFTFSDCVDNVCKCRDQFSGSPYKLTSITLLSDNNVYEISCERTEEYANLEMENVFHEMFYESTKSNSTITYINYDEVVFNNMDSKIIVPLHDLKAGSSYVLGAKFVVDYCLYFSSIEFHLPQEKENHMIFIVGVIFLITVPLAATLFYFRKNTKLLVKIRRYLKLPQVEVPPVIYTRNVESPRTVIKEEVSSQYTPLEFVLQSHKYDKYEFPRNKVVFQNELGSGAFGKVSEAKVYEIAGQPGYSIIAVKQLLDNAPEEESQDFLAEIELLKRIDRHGGHVNVIKILGCVTMEQPYLIIMELAPCGSLYKYLRNLRDEWEKQKRAWRGEIEIQKTNSTQRFFPEDMEESWLQPASSQVKEENKNQGLKYTKLEFEDSDENWLPRNPSDGSGSYISPDSPTSITSTTPKTPKTPSPYVPSPRTPTSKKLQDFVRKFPAGGLRRLNSTSSNVSNGGLPSITSVTSSRLPSITETLMTNLTDNETPLLDEEVPTIQPALSHIELQQFAFQIANGMAYLESISVTHRDLAARNILLAKGKVLKISDFGLARTGNYVTKKNKKMPLRWMAPEAIQRKRCDNKSDVWSFGVVLWEIGSLGAFPYHNTDNSLILHNLKKGLRLEPPKVCTEELYSMMERCWSLNPDDRPDFKELVKTLDINKQKVYVDFNQISPNYVFPTAREHVSDENIQNSTFDGGTEVRCVAISNRVDKIKKQLLKVPSIRVGEMSRANNLNQRQPNSPKNSIK